MVLSRVLSSIDTHAVWAIRKADEYRGLSTVSNLVVIALKCLAHLAHFFRIRPNIELIHYLKAKSFKECVFLLDPFYGQRFVMKNRLHFDHHTLQNHPKGLMPFVVLDSYCKDYPLIAKAMRDNPVEKWPQDFKDQVKRDRTTLVELIKIDWRLVADFLPSDISTRNNIYDKLGDHEVKKNEGFCIQLVKSVPRYLNRLDPSLKLDEKFHIKMIDAFKDHPDIITELLCSYKWDALTFSGLDTKKIYEHVSLFYKDDEAATTLILKRCAWFWQFHSTNYLKDSSENDARMENLIKASITWTRDEQNSLISTFLEASPRQLFLILRCLRSLIKKGEIIRLMVRQAYYYKTSPHNSFMSDTEEERNKKNLGFLYNELKQKTIRKTEREDDPWSKHFLAIDKILNLTSFIHLVLAQKHNKLPVVLPKVILKEIHAYIDFSIPK